MQCEYGIVNLFACSFASLNNRRFPALTESKDGLVTLVVHCAYPYEGLFFTKGLLRGASCPS